MWSPLRPQFAEGALSLETKPPSQPQSHQHPSATSQALNKNGPELCLCSLHKRMGPHPFFSLFMIYLSFWFFFTSVLILSFLDHVTIQTRICVMPPIVILCLVQCRFSCSCAISPYLGAKHLLICSHSSVQHRSYPNNSNMKNKTHAHKERRGVICIYSGFWRILPALPLIA